MVFKPNSIIENKIREYCKQKKIVNAPEVHAAIGHNIITIRKHLTRLTDAGVLEKHQIGRQSFYSPCGGSPQ